MVFCAFKVFDASNHKQPFLADMLIQYYHAAHVQITQDDSIPLKTNPDMLQYLKQSINWVTS